MFKFFQKKPEVQPVIPTERVAQVLRSTERRENMVQASQAPEDSDKDA